jgi:GWxTD domain-containing protein
MNRVISLSDKFIYLILPFFFGILVSCGTSKKAVVDSKDLSYLYNPTKSPIKPRFNVLNQTEESSTLSVKFFAAELFFSEANPQGVPMAQLIISVRLHNITGGGILADTAYNTLNIVKEESSPEYVFRIPLKTEPLVEYMVEVKILDRLRLQIVQAFVPFNTLSQFNRYNFIAQGHFRKNELFDPVVRRNEYVNLLYPGKPVDSLYVSFYKAFKEVPYPPSMLLPEKTIDYDPDTTIAFSYSDTLPMMFPREGVYLCSAGRNVREGFAFYNFGESYPSMTEPEVMIEPITYLASEEEMTTLRTSTKPKMALDDFWIKCGGNVEKARELIRIYYTRVLFSNYYFTSFKEGWRTERGMIYTIYGPPDKVYKTAEGENWGYRKPVIRSSWGGRYHLREEYLFFNFRYRANAFTGNDYYLSRSETLVTYWDRAIANWRKGIVFRLDNPDDF